MKKLAGLPSGGNFHVVASVGLGGSAAGINPIRCELRDDGTVLTAGDAYSDQAVFSDTVTLAAFANGGNIALACNPTVASQARDRVITATRVAKVQQQ